MRANVKLDYVGGNCLVLLLSGREYFRALEAAIASAAVEIFVETYIFSDEGTAARVTAALVVRDNLRHRRDIERAYLTAITGARQEIVLANACFFPGRRFRHALISAARPWPQRVRIWLAYGLVRLMMRLAGYGQAF